MHRIFKCVHAYCVYNRHCKVKNIIMTKKNDEIKLEICYKEWKRYRLLFIFGGIKRSVCLTEEEKIDITSAVFSTHFGVLEPPKYDPTCLIRPLIDSCRA